LPKLSGKQPKPARGGTRSRRCRKGSSSPSCWRRSRR
jgi:hypothetical protein